MSTYRDERDALRARAETLEQDLESKQRELDALRGDGTTAERIDRLARELESAQAELGKLKAAVAPTPLVPRGLRMLLSGLAFALIIGIALAQFRRSTAVESIPPRPPERPAPVLVSDAPVAVEAPIATIVEPIQDLRATIQWKGQVKSATGISLRAGTPCIAQGTFARRPPAKLGIDVLTVVCGTSPLYGSKDAFNGISNTSWHLDEEPAQGGGFQHALTYEDSGSWTGTKNQVSIDTTKHSAKVWSSGAAGISVLVTIDELGDTQQTQLFPDGVSADGKKQNSSDACPRFSSKAKVVEATGDTTVKANDTCEVSLHPSGYQCRVFVTCGKTKLYDGGYADKQGDKIIDDLFSVQDRDPKVTVDLGERHVEVSDEAVTRWKVEIELEHGI